jgi:hypothetical protein
MVQVDNVQNMVVGGDAISAGKRTTKRTINTRTKYVLIGSDFSQQE